MITLLRGRSVSTRALIVTAAIALRLAVVALTFPGDAGVESWEDVAIAQNILAGKGYSIDNSWRYRMVYYFVESEIHDAAPDGYRETTLKPPVYPFIVVALFSVFGASHFLPLLILNAILAGATAHYLFQLLRTQSETAALIGASVFAVYPPFVYHSATTPESTWLVVFLLVLFIARIRQLVTAGSGANGFITGLVGGLLVMTHPVYLASVGAAGCVAVVAARGFTARCLRPIAYFLVGVSLCVAPWLLRNYLIFDDVLIKGGVGHALLKARYTSGDALWLPAADILKVEAAGRHLNEAQEDELLKSVVVPAAIRDKREFAKTVGQNFAHLWVEPHDYEGNTSLAYLVGRKVPYLTLLVIAGVPLLLGLGRLVASPLQQFRHNSIEATAIVFIVWDTIAFSIFGAWNIRYHFPIEALMIPFFATGCLAMRGFVWRNLGRSPNAMAGRA